MQILNNKNLAKEMNPVIANYSKISQEAAAEMAYYDYQQVQDSLSVNAMMANQAILNVDAGALVGSNVQQATNVEIGINYDGLFLTGYKNKIMTAGNGNSTYRMTQGLYDLIFGA